MFLAVLFSFNPLLESQHPFNCFLEGHNSIKWNLATMLPPPIIMGLYARLQFMPAHFMQTFEEAFLNGYFVQQSNIFGSLNPKYNA